MRTFTPRVRNAARSFLIKSAFSAAWTRRHLVSNAQKRKWQMDNSGRGPLRVPGFGGIPIDYQLPVEDRFAHGVQEWQQIPMITAQEMAMVTAMNWVTDKPTWVKDVFDDSVMARWRAELKEESLTLNPRLLQDKSWEWCVKELRDKAAYYKDHGYVRVLDTGTCVCKADSAELESLSKVFRRTVAPLAQQCLEDQERLKRLGKWVPQDGDHVIKQDEHDENGGHEAGDVLEMPQADGLGFHGHLTLLGQEEVEYAEAVEHSQAVLHPQATEHPEVIDRPQADKQPEVIGYSQALEHPQALENQQDDAVEHRSLLAEHDIGGQLDTAEPSLGDNASEQGPSTDELPSDWDETPSNWAEILDAQLGDLDDRDFDDSKKLDIQGCAHMVSPLIDPLLYPLVYGRTLVLQDGGAVGLKDVLALYRAAHQAPRPPPVADEDYSWRDHSVDGAVECPPWSARYQSLPCEVAFVGHAKTDGEQRSCNTAGVEITSCINGLRPDCYSEMYGAIEQVLSRAIAPWNDCLVRGRSGMHNRYDFGQKGPVPSRIITYGVEWENELPDWAAAFQMPVRSRRMARRREREHIDRLPEGEMKLRREKEYSQSALADWIGKEDEELPPRDSELWERAKEFLMRPDLPGRSPVFPNDWEIGNEATWGILRDKVNRIIRHKHPEAGTAFSYEDWKLSRHASRPVVDKFIRQEAREEPEFLTKLVIPPHMPYVVALQDDFRDQGLQVVVEMSSIDLTPETPSYAPDAATRAAKQTAKYVQAYNTAISQDEIVSGLPWRRPDYDGWQVAGNLNEHIVAVAMFAFDVTNVTTPYVAFRQRMSLDLSLHRFREFGEVPDNAPPYYNHTLDGPPRWAGKYGEFSALAEILGVSEMNLDMEIIPHSYQQMGSVAMSQGRLVAFPNVIEHRVDPFCLVDKTQPGRFRWLKLSLVDPHYRVCSTRNVPPQQHGWWAGAMRRPLTTTGLPQEVIDRIMHYTDDWPMSMAEAQWLREQMVKEQRQSDEYRTDAYASW